MFGNWNYAMHIRRKRRAGAKRLSPSRIVCQIVHKPSIVGPLAVAMAFVCSGCGDSSPYGQVSGKIEFGGKPVPAGNKVFFEQSSTGILAAGVIQDDGAYALNVQGSPKIPLGDYVVFVGPPTSNMSEAEFRALKKKVDAEYRSRGEEPPPFPDWVLPAKFYRSTTSPLRKTVEAGENQINLSLD